MFHFGMMFVDDEGEQSGGGRAGTDMTEAGEGASQANALSVSYETSRK
jgi:hypothetical protein